MIQPIQELEAAFQELTEDDFEKWDDKSRGIERLRELTERLLKLGQPTQVAELILSTMERLGECHLGSPGPLIHTLEKLPGYEPYLIRSLERKPTPLSVWALNRILNTVRDLKKREQLLKLMHCSLTHPLASQTTKQEAEMFLEHQAKQKLAEI